VARAQPAREMQGMSIRHLHDCVLARISSGMSADASELHRLDLERLGLRALAACQFQEMLADLKERIAQRAAMRTRSPFAIGGVELRSAAA